MISELIITMKIIVTIIYGKLISFTIHCKACICNTVGAWSNRGTKEASISKIAIYGIIAKYDIILLANNFAVRMASERGRDEIPIFSEEVEKKLLSYSWPGNVRELQKKHTKPNKF